MHCLYRFVAATCLCLLLIASVAGCTNIFGEEVVLSASVHEYGLTTIDSASVEAHGSRTNSTFSSPVSPPGSANKRSGSDLAVLQINGVLLDGEPMESLGHRRFETRFDSALHRDHEYTLEFDLYEDVGDVDGNVKFTLRKDYTLHGLPEGDSLARGDTLHLWWNTVDTGWDGTYLVLSHPPYGNSDQIYSHPTSADSSEVVIPGFPANVDRVRIEFVRELSEWYGGYDNRYVYYHLDGMKEYVLTGNP